MIDLTCLFDVIGIKNKVEVEWDVFSQELASSNQTVEDIEEPFIHVADIASGAHGQYTFKVAYELLEEKELDMEDMDGPYSWTDECIDDWNLEVKKVFGEEYFADWFSTDGSISIFYRPIWDEQDLADNFSGSWKKSIGVPEDDNLTEGNLLEYLSEVERVLRREFLLEK